MAVSELDEQFASWRLARPERLAVLRRSITLHGVLRPIVVNQAGAGRAAVLDGFKRLRVVRELGRTEIRVDVLALSEPDARAAMFTYNAVHAGGLCELEEGWIVRALVRDFGVRQKDVATQLGRDKSWVCRRLMLAEQLDESVQGDMRLGLISASVARELGRLPRGNQGATAAAIVEHGLTSRQTGELVLRMLGASDTEAAAAVLTDPLRFLDLAKQTVAGVTPSDPRLSRAGEDIRRWLVRFDQAASGLKQSLVRFPLPGLPKTDRRVLEAGASEAATLAKHLLKTLSAWPTGEESSGDA